MRCPKCNRIFNGPPALSRRDNKTKICPRCGMEEALDDAGVLAPDKNEWELQKQVVLDQLYKGEDTP